MFEYRKWITRNQLKEQPDTLFVFGDNMQRRGYGGQAKQMRGEPNAIGIPTKMIPSMHPNAFLTDQHYDQWLREAQKDIDRLISHKGPIVWPMDGIGTGLAKLDQTAPRIFKRIKKIERFLQEQSKPALF